MRLQVFLATILIIASQYLEGVKAQTQDQEIYIPPLELFKDCKSLLEVMDINDARMCNMQLEQYRKFFGTKAKDDSNIITINYALLERKFKNNTGIQLNVKVIYQEGWDCLDKIIVSRSVSDKAYKVDGTLFRDFGASWWRVGRADLLPLGPMPDQIKMLADRFCDS